MKVQQPFPPGSQGSKKEMDRTDHHNVRYHHEVITEMLWHVFLNLDRLSRQTQGVKSQRTHITQICLEEKKILKVSASF